jgi:FixJ family two-component response regulator
LERLEEKQRALWQELAAGKKLRQIACEQGLSYDAVKRRRRKLLAHLSKVVRSWQNWNATLFEN